MGECEPGCKELNISRNTLYRKNEEFKYKKLISAVYYQINELLSERRGENPKIIDKKFNKNSELDEFGFE